VKSDNIRVVNRLLEKGMTARSAQEIMGYSYYNTTVSYTHCLEDVKQREAQKVGNFLNVSDSKHGVYEIMNYCLEYDTIEEVKSDILIYLGGFYGDDGKTIGQHIG
jgi:hypothetical protein